MMSGVVEEVVFFFFKHMSAGHDDALALCPIQSVVCGWYIELLSAGRVPPSYLFFRFTRGEEASSAACVQFFLW